MLDYIVQKVFSARFWMTLLFTATACYGFLIGKLDSQAFVGLCGGVVSSYFLMNKNPVEKKEENGKSNSV